MAANDGQERTEDATPKRRLDARRKGTVARSPDLTGALVLLALSLILPFALSRLGIEAMQTMRSVLVNVPSEPSGASIASFVMVFLRPGVVLFLSIAAVTLAVGLAANFAQVGFVLSAESMAPSLEKLNPIQGFKRLFSARAGVEALKTIAKSLLFGYIAYSAIAGRWEEVVGLAWLTPPAAASHVGEILHTVLLRVSLVWLGLAILDYLFQRKQIDKQLRMTKDELKREMKDQETSPELKMVMAQRRRKLAKGRMMDRVKEADVVITNPQHYAVAVKYERSSMHAPMVVAKGADYLALRIRETAQGARVPIVPNPPLARALYKKCEVGDFVPRDLFQAVAEVLAYVYRTLRKVRR
ncbi:MAG TPA: flagellar biosynthesis protein FlhB [Fimbriimonadaceae bacterium]|nr:flagellar biosynthesis protein FlhB [Fimbriimonadaceae bacterium]HRJ96595.1 flagellar biosynthesis protein FlhB [Fimbriimonadaceae bacterium]